jgi:hypothetical protein
MFVNVQLPFETNISKYDLSSRKCFQKNSTGIYTIGNEMFIFKDGCVLENFWYQVEVLFGLRLMKTISSLLKEKLFNGV